MGSRKESSGWAISSFSGALALSVKALQPRLCSPSPLPTAVLQTSRYIEGSISFILGDGRSMYKVGRAPTATDAIA
ncbi:hypothetical protein Taro_035583 [Colocasia esculenta]|uniref:Uncharacterized protein n=1 Tax=Colocasia esculenta TaxID=4460 RepID=A0A843W730_COLES|nr:hypothetical protein [Colocasia esculenta]